VENRCFDVMSLNGSDRENQAEAMDQPATGGMRIPTNPAAAS